MEEKFARQILEEMPFAYSCHRIILNKKGEPEDYIFFDVNHAFEEMTGLKKEAILGKKITEVIPGMEDDNWDWIKFYAKVALIGEKQEFIWHVEPLKHWYKITAFALEKDYLITIFQEITSEMEQIKIFESQKREVQDLKTEFEAVFDSSQDAIFMLGLEEGELRYLRTNKVHQEMTGFSLADIKGKTPAELFGKEIGKKIVDSYNKVDGMGSGMIYEETIDLPGGKRIWRTRLTTVGEGGTPKYLIGSSRDITEQRQAEREREELSKLLQAMFDEHTAVMLFIEPYNGKITAANPAACNFYGYTREELLDMYIYEINMLPSEEVKKQYFMALQGKRRYFMAPHRLKNGETRLVDVYSCPVSYGGENLLFSVVFDVTEREKYREELYREKELLRITLLSIGDGVVTTDRTGRIKTMNKVAEEVVGWSEEEAQGKPFAEVFRMIRETTGEEVEDLVAKVLRTEKAVSLADYTALINKEGQRISIAASAAPIKDEKGNVYGAVVVFRDIRKEKANQEKIIYLNYHDVVTGLYNRRFMEERISQMNVSEELPLALIMADVNGLKLVNDVFGHEKGDELLQKTAGVIKMICGESAVVARWGGDEFLILLPRTSAEEARKVMGKIRKRCLRAKTDQVPLSIAMGCAVKYEPSGSMRQLIKEAEEGMYRQKLLEDKSYRNKIMNTMLTTLAAKSTETEEHAERLKTYCLLIGQKMGLEDKDLDELALLAMLHDIGKIGVKESILNKPGPLDDKEWEEMKKHTEIGYRIARNIPELASISDYILSHHERWDGKGYPQGLKGEEIPLVCRILAVVDAYDAMTSDRSYRKALSVETALAEIKRNAGIQFDPEVVEIFIELIRSQALRQTKI
ncbi:PAS domain S-box protein [Thermosyntropha sp.]|uniref:PAS domain S-box protein n=1 Tax=Thermosyntropha sp. TaxID=2740820 RepID=UPI0025DFC668|nr:PAS domain S-box protein [Thermosyntropha sp.]MBO8158132.1 PAS domain S-box protein [Thermosyntropha sp.]